MRFADTEQWLGVALVALWLLTAGLSMIGRVPWRKRVSAATLIGTGVAAGLFTLQATVVDAVADPAGISAADAPLLQWLVAHRTPAATVVAMTISTVGGTAGMAVLATLAALVLWLRHRRWEAGVVIVAAAGAGVLVETLKNLYDRIRPPEATRLVVETNFSLPSGHALGSTVVLGILAAVAALVLRGTAARVTAVVLAAVLVAAIGVSRLYLGVHWLTDVLDGWLVGGTWLALCVMLLVHRQPVPLPDPDPATAVGPAPDLAPELAPDPLADAPTVGLLVDPPAGRPTQKRPATADAPAEPPTIPGPRGTGPRWWVAPAPGERGRPAGGPAPQ
jgi:membrane-associated phospholipid phosphatase